MVNKCMINLDINLISPVVDDGHVDIINEYCHLLASWWTICCTHTFVHQTFNGSLEHKRRCGAWEVEALEQVQLGIIFAAVALDHHCLSCTLYNRRSWGYMLGKYMQWDGLIQVLQKKIPYAILGQCSARSDHLFAPSDLELYMLQNRFTVYAVCGFECNENMVYLILQ